jgi:hypothetical protein
MIALRVILSTAWRALALGAGPRSYFALTT